MNYSLLIILCSFLFACGATPTPQVDPPVNQKPTLEKTSQRTAQESSITPQNEESAIAQDKSSSEKQELTQSPETESDNTANKSDKTPLNSEEKAALEESYVLMNEAKEKLQSDQLEKGQQILSRVAARTPNIPEVHYNLGVIAERLGSLAQARKSYKDALKAQSDFTPSWIALTKLAQRTGNEGALLSEIDTQLRQEPKNVGLLNAKARLELSTKANLNKVIRLSKLALREDEQNTYAMVTLASTFAAQQKYELSLAILENAKELNPDDPEISLGLYRKLECTR